MAYFSNLRLKKHCKFHTWFHYLFIIGKIDEIESKQSPLRPAATTQRQGRQTLGKRKLVNHFVTNTCGRISYTEGIKLEKDRSIAARHVFIINFYVLLRFCKFYFSIARFFSLKTYGSCSRAFVPNFMKKGSKLFNRN